jgi:hypothetical protein
MWYPDVNEAFTGVGEVTLDVSDDNGIAKVELVTDEGVVLGRADKPPYRLLVPSWQHPDGDIWLQLVATDLNGNTAESNRAHIEITNSAPGTMPAEIAQPPPPLSGVGAQPAASPSAGSDSHTH